MKQVKRGCGYRIKGGIYLVTQQGRRGREVEHFIIDPPKPIPPDMRISAQGMTPIRRPGLEITHAMNWVGYQNYPNPSDFVEEVRRHGGSSRVPQNFDFKLLTEGSNILHIHSRAIIDDPVPYNMNPPISCGKPCPIKSHQDTDIHQMCARLWWEDVENGELTGKDKPAEMPRQVRRRIGSIEYEANCRPYFEAPQPNYSPGMFFWLPIHRVEVVRDDEDEEHTARALGLATASDIDVRVVDF